MLDYKSCVDGEVDQLVKWGTLDKVYSYPKIPIKCDESGNYFVGVFARLK